MTNLIGRTPEFDTWLDGMRDIDGKAAVLTRLDRAEENNFGDCEPVGDGMSEMRVFVGLQNLFCAYGYRCLLDALGQR